MNRSKTERRFVLVSVLALLPIVTATMIPLADGTLSCYTIPYIVFMRTSLLILLTYHFLSNLSKIDASSLTTRLVLAWCVWVIISSAFSEYTFSLGVRHIIELPAILLLWPLSYLFFQSEAKQFTTSNRRNIVGYFYCIFIVYSCVCILCIIGSRGNHDDRVFAGINAVYYPLLLVPWILLIRRYVFQYSALAITAIMVFASMKRTACLAFIGSMIAYAILSALIKSSGKSIARTIQLSIVSLVVYVAMNSNKEAFEYFAKRFEHDNFYNGSGRWDIYQDTFNLITSSSLLGLLVGHGVGSVAMHLGSSAHNDMLEVLYDFGVGGLALYMVLHFTIVVKTISLIRKRSEYASALGASYLIFLFMSLTSHLIIFPTYFIFLASFWGMTEGSVFKRSLRGLTI